jgi:uncharacterized protein YbaP (TraB family)
VKKHSPKKLQLFYFSVPFYGLVLNFFLDVKSILNTIILLIALVGDWPVVAQKSARESSLLWKITGNGLKQPSYLYGTIHFIPLTHFLVTNAVVEAFQSSKILATENAAFMRYIPRQVWREKNQQQYLPDEQTVANYLSEAEFAELTTYMRKGLRIKKRVYRAYLRLKPNYLAGTLLERLHPQSTGYEVVFRQQARLRNTRGQYMLYEGLEEPKQTFAAFDSLEHLYRMEELIQGIRDGFATYHSLLQLYRAQDIEAMYEASVKDGKLHQILVVDRNQAWLGKLRKLIHSQPTFVAVGAAHLGGPTGLIELLTGSGYTLQPVHDKWVNKEWTYDLFNKGQ